jgi:hypothetical protein
MFKDLLFNLFGCTALQNIPRLYTYSNRLYKRWKTGVIFMYLYTNTNGFE